MFNIQFQKMEVWTGSLPALCVPHAFSSPHFSAPPSQSLVKFIFVVKVLEGEQGSSKHVELQEECGSLISGCKHFSKFVNFG